MSDQMERLRSVRDLMLASLECPCCFGGCDCGCVLDCPRHLASLSKEADR